MKAEKIQWTESPFLIVQNNDGSHTMIVKTDGGLFEVPAFKRPADEETTKDE